MLDLEWTAHHLPTPHHCGSKRVKQCCSQNCTAVPLLELREWLWKLPLVEALGVLVASAKLAKFQLALWAILLCGR